MKTPGTITPPAFPGDDGSADPALREALARWREASASAGDLGAASGGAAVRAVHEALLGARLLVPIVAVETDTPGEHGAEMRLLAIAGPGGAQGLPAFTGMDALAAWDRAARPVAVPAVRACQAALVEGAGALLVDPGPSGAPFVLHGPALRAFAAGRVPLPPAEDAEVLAAVGAAVAEHREVRQAHLGADGGGALVLVLEPTGPVDAAATAAKAIGRRLAADEVLRDRLSRPIRLALLPSGDAAPRDPGPGEPGR